MMMMMMMMMLVMFAHSHGNKEQYELMSNWEIIVPWVALTVMQGHCLPDNCLFLMMINHHHRHHHVVDDDFEDDACRQTALTLMLAHCVSDKRHVHAGTSIVDGLRTLSC